MTAILEARGLEKWYGRRKVVDGVSFEVHPGEIVGLLGPNGAGKTTSFRMTTGQIAPNAGMVLFNGQDVTDLPMYQRARLGMGYLSQEASIFRRLTVEQNILAILEALPRSRSLNRALTRRERWARTDEMLTRFGLNHVRKNNSARCSGGEKRRLEIARCLACEPMMILLDEPFAAVDPLTKTDIQEVVRGLASSGISILVTDHDVDRVLELADRIYLITEGQVRCEGTPAQIVRDRAAIDSYLGERYYDREFDSQPEPAAEAHHLMPQQFVEPERDVQTLALVHGLMGDEAQFRACASELMARPEAALPVLLEALEQRDMEMRRRAYAVVYQMTQGQAVFDPHAPPAYRQQQLAHLREQLLARV